MILASLLLAVTATFHPPAPTVGDLITVTFDGPAVLERSDAYEIVSAKGNQVVVRTFRPQPFVLSGTTGGVAFTNLAVPVHSVLKKGDKLEPAPLAPPVHVPYPRAPFYAIAAAALVAVAVWLLVWWRSRVRTAVPTVPALAPDERFRRAVLALRAGAGKRWAALADETRLYLAATRPMLRRDLSTTELVPLLPGEARVVETILRQGDREKFSTRGPEPMSFDEVSARALALVPVQPQQEPPQP